MEGSYMNSTSLGDNNPINYTDDCFYDYNSTYYYYCFDDYGITLDVEEIKRILFILYVVNCVVISTGLPLTLVAIYALYSMIQKDHVAPIYVINLLISDLIQLCCMTVQIAQRGRIYMTGTIYYIYLCGLVASVCFMVCVALERYLVIAWPLWYRCRRTIKTSVVICVVVWIIPPLSLLPSYLENHFVISENIFAVFLLLPLPLLIFFLVGTLKALSASISVTSDEKRRIVGTLVLVLLIYTLLFLPSVIRFLARYRTEVTDVSLVFLQLNPLADSLLYIFMRKGMIDKLLASVCCCRMDSNDSTMSSV